MLNYATYMYMHVRIWICIQHALRCRDLSKIQEGIGEKIPMFLYFFSTFMGAIISAFYHGWELTLVIFCSMPVLIFTMGMVSKVQSMIWTREVKYYDAAGCIAQEALSAIRTVVSFGGEDREVSLYKGHLDGALRLALIRGLTNGIGIGLMWAIIFSSYGLAFWYGINLIMDDRENCLKDFSTCVTRYDSGTMFVVFLSVLLGSANMGQSIPYLDSFSIARGAAAVVFHVIDRVPPIDIFSPAGRQPKPNAGTIEFKDVHFCYPSRPSVKVRRTVRKVINHAFFFDINTISDPERPQSQD